MKKIVSLIMALLLVLSSALSAAEEKEQDFSFNPFDYGDYIIHSCLNEGKLVGLGAKLYEIDLESKKATVIAGKAMGDDNLISAECLVSYKGELYIFSAESLNLYKLNISEDLIEKGESVHHFEANIGEADYEGAKAAFVLDGVFYINLKDASGISLDKLLVSYNFETGEQKQSRFTNIAYAAPYKDGRLFVVLSKEGSDTEDNEDLEDFTLAVYDPITDSLTEDLLKLKGIDSYSFPRLFYSAKMDGLYMPRGGEILKINNDGTFETAAYLPVSAHSLNNVVELLDGRFAFLLNFNEDVVAIRSLDPAQKPSRALKIVNPDEYYITKAISKCDFPVITLEDYQSSAQELAGKIISASDSFDIMQLYSDSIDISNLIKKGYLAEIKSEKLIVFANSLAEPVKELIFKDGKLYALPMLMHANAFYYDSGAYNALNMVLPKTTLELLEAYYNFEMLEDDVKANYNFCEEDYFFKSLNTAVATYAASKIVNEKELVFNSPEFKALAAQIKKNAGEVRGKVLDWGNSDEMTLYRQKPSLVHIFNGESAIDIVPSFSSPENKRELIPLEFAVEGNDKSYVAGTLNLFLINSQSKNIDLAERFLEAFLDTLNPAYSALLQTKLSGPIEAPDFEIKKERLDAQISQIKAKLEKLSGAERDNYLENYGYALQNYDSLIKDIRYIVPPEKVDIFNELFKQKLFIRSYMSSLYSGSEVLTPDLEERYMNGSINEDMLASELDNRVKLIKLEKQ